VDSAALILDCLQMGRRGEPPMNLFGHTPLCKIRPSASALYRWTLVLRRPLRTTFSGVT